MTSNSKYDCSNAESCIGHQSSHPLSRKRSTCSSGGSIQEFNNNLAGDRENLACSSGKGAVAATESQTSERLRGGLKAAARVTHLDPSQFLRTWVAVAHQNYKIKSRATWAAKAANGRAALCLPRFENCIIVRGTGGNALGRSEQRSGVGTVFLGASMTRAVRFSLLAALHNDPGIQAH